MWALKVTGFKKIITVRKVSNTLGKNSLSLSLERKCTFHRRWKMGYVINHARDGRNSMVEESVQRMTRGWGMEDVTIDIKQHGLYY